MPPIYLSQGEGGKKGTQQWRKWNWSRRGAEGIARSSMTTELGGFGSGLLQYSDTEKCKSNISEWEGAAGWAINLSVKNGARTVIRMCSVMVTVWVVRWQPSSMKENITFRLMCEFLLNLIWEKQHHLTYLPGVIEGFSVGSCWISS